VSGGLEFVQSHMTVSGHFPSERFSRVRSMALLNQSSLLSFGHNIIAKKEPFLCWQQAPLLTCLCQGSTIQLSRHTFSILKKGTSGQAATAATIAIASHYAQASQGAKGSDDSAAVIIATLSRRRIAFDCAFLRIKQSKQEKTEASQRASDPIHSFSRPHLISSGYISWFCGWLCCSVFISQSLLFIRAVSQAKQYETLCSRVILCLSQHKDFALRS